MPWLRFHRTSSTPHLVKVSAKSIYKVTLVFLQHLDQSLQLCKPEALSEGASALEGCPGPLDQILPLHRVGLQRRLPQRGPETQHISGSPTKTPPQAQTSAKAVPPAGVAASPPTGLTCPKFSE